MMTTSRNWHLEAPPRTESKLHELEAKAVITERLRKLDMLSENLTSLDVGALVSWLESEDFQKTCAAADAEPAAVREKFNKIVTKSFDHSLMAL